MPGSDQKIRVRRRRYGRGFWPRQIAVITAVALLVTMTETPTSAAAASPIVTAPAKKQACPTERPDEQAALTTARICGGDVKIASQTTEYDQGWAQPDGSVRWEHRYRPVRVQRDNAWVAVDTTLKRAADGTVQPAATAVGLTFSGGGAGALVTVTEAGGTLHSWVRRWEASRRRCWRAAPPPIRMFCLGSTCS